MVLNSHNPLERAGLYMVLGRGCAGIVEALKAGMLAYFKLADYAFKTRRVLAKWV